MHPLRQQLVDARRHSAAIYELAALQTSQALAACRGSCSPGTVQWLLQHRPPGNQPLQCLDCSLGAWRHHWYTSGDSLYDMAPTACAGRTWSLRRAGPDSEPASGLTCRTQRAQAAQQSGPVRSRSHTPASPQAASAALTTLDRASMQDIDG